MEFILDALKDSAILFPFLFVAYVLIELIETLMQKRVNKKVLNNRLAPLVGAGVGLLPQCGFSVVATDLFSHKKITMGALLAVFIATSDEAIPLLAVAPQKAIYLLPLLAIKFVYAVLIGFGCDALVKIINKKAKKQNAITLSEEASQSATITETDSEHEHSIAHESEQTETHDDHAHQETETHIGCCGHHIEEEENEHWAKRYLLHPLIHSLKIFAFILAVNLVFGGLVAWIGETNLTNFLMSSKPFAPLFAVIIGLIPNCASSIIITELFIKGGLTFGACLAGLCANAGIGLVVLFKQNKNAKQNIAIVLTLLLSSLALGYATQLIMHLI